jgi:hypothetical protein
MANARDHVTGEAEERARLDETARRMIGEIRPDIDAIEKAIPRQLFIRKRFTYEPTKLRVELRRRRFSIFLQPRMDVTLSPFYTGRTWGYLVRGLEVVSNVGCPVGLHDRLVSKDEAVAALAKHVAGHLHSWGLKPE